MSAGPFCNGCLVYPIVETSAGLPLFQMMVLLVMVLDSRQLRDKLSGMADVSLGEEAHAQTTMS